MSTAGSSATAGDAGQSAVDRKPARVPGTDAARPALTAAGRGSAIGREVGRLGVELTRIALGRSAVAPARGDRRFADPAWNANPVFRRVQQTHLASADALMRMVDHLGAGPHAERARFAASVLSSAAAPTNFLLSNPAAIRRSFETGGISLLNGVSNFLSDLRHNGGMPSMVDRTAFQLGRDLALTPGAVVARDAVGEVLQYASATQTVHERPVLVVPPPIGRFYFLDLRPGRSLVEYAASRGLQTFLLSWRNPTAEQGDWDLDTYSARVSAAIDTVREITGAPDINVIGFCAGGIITTTLLNHMAVTGDQRIHSMSYAVTLLDFGLPAPITAFSGRGLLTFARRRSRRTGIITSRQMGSAFTWMRPDDLVFNYWVNNYLMGEKPPAFDILAWNADGTNLPGALHSQFLDMFEDNVLAKQGAMTVLGTPVELGRITVPMFVTGAINDHLTPWKGCYRTTQLLSGESTFVLSHAGHIASLVNPTGNPKAHYWTGPAPGPDPDQWLATAQRHAGSWWEPWADWLTARAGERRPATDRLGSEQHPVLEPAPGRYVRDLMPE